MARVPKVEVPRPGAKSQERASGGLPVETLDDRELVRKAQKGSQEAYEVLIQRHQHRVFAVARGIIKRQEDVEDIAQQVFVKAYFSLKRFDQRAAFSTWLYKITVNECWDLLRKRKVRPLVYEADLSEEQSREYSATENLQASGPDAADRLAAKQEISRLLSHLEERDRLMLIMKEVEGFSVEEIGDVLDLNANTVKVRLFRARRKIVGLARKKD